MKSSAKVLAERGYIDDSFIEPYKTMDEAGLLHHLSGGNPQERTACAFLLGEKKSKPAIIPLCSLLERERKLYTKIAVCDALVRIGEDAIPQLIDRLGEIGNNQHRSLPLKPFNKNNYPLPRDIVARTLAKIGAPALPHLEKLIRGTDIIKISEAIDAVGYIAWYTNIASSLDALKECLEINKSNAVIHWKIIRAFQSFADDLVKLYLRMIIVESDQKQFVWEAQRSLAQIRSKEI